MCTPYSCFGQFPGGYCYRKTGCLCPVNPNPVYGGCTSCLTYSPIPRECPCPGLPGCYKDAATARMTDEYRYANRGIGCNCPCKVYIPGGLAPCPCPPKKLHYLQTYGPLPPPSKLVPGYLNQGTDKNFKTRWFPVSWGDILGCSNKFHMKGLRVKDSLLRSKDCEEPCDCCCYNLNRGERLRIISNGKRVYGAGDEVLRCKALEKSFKKICPSQCNCPVRPIVRNCCCSKCCC